MIMPMFEDFSLTALIRWVSEYFATPEWWSTNPRMTDASRWSISAPSISGNHNHVTINPCFSACEGNLNFRLASKGTSDTLHFFLEASALDLCRHMLLLFM
jgi:hypothetical protein